MGKLSVKLYDNSFNMCGPSCGTGSTGIASKNIDWYIGHDSRPISVFTDQCLNRVDESTSQINIAWLIEPKVISPGTYNWITSNYEKFDYVMTHDKSLLSIDDRFKIVPLCGHWIFKQDSKIHNKTKDISIIASNKTQTDGHNLRHQIIRSYGSRITGVFGNGYNPIDNKITGLKDYRYHIVIENVQLDYWFTEKLIDAFVTGCIPIYYGCPSIGEYFNTDGMILIDSLSDFGHSIDYCTEENYKLKQSAIKDNFERAKRFLTPEDYMYEVLIKEL